MPVSPLRLATCNIQSGLVTQKYRDYLLGAWRHIRPSGKRPGLAATAQHIQPFDVVALQECDVGSWRSAFTNQTELIAQQAEFPHWVHRTNRRIGPFASSALGVISRLPLENTRGWTLPSPIPGRGVLATQIQWQGRVLNIGVVHLSLGPRARAQQVQALLPYLHKDEPWVLMGDFNCPSDAPELEPLFEQTGLLRPPEAMPATYPSWAPERALDHILVSHHLRIQRVSVWAHPTSDHCGVGVDVAWGRARGAGPSRPQVALRQGAAAKRAKSSVTASSGEGAGRAAKKGRKAS